jgi:DNA-binding beta-propeller fold protein YncE
VSQRSRDVNPIIAVVAIVIALGVVQFAYWRGLVGRPPEPMGTRSGGGAGGADEEGASAPVDVDVSTIAGTRVRGHEDGPAASARFNGPAALAVARDGTVYIADSRNHCLRRLSRDGSVGTLAGEPGVAGYADGRGGEARFSNPAGLAVLGDGSVLIADTGNHRLRRVSRTGLVVTVAGCETPRDDLGRELGGYRDGPAQQAQFRFPVGLAVTPEGSILVGDAGNGCIRAVRADGRVTTIPVGEGERLEAPTHLALAAEGTLWAADSASGSLWVGPIAGPLRRWEGEAAELVSPAGLADVWGADAVLVAADSKANCLWHVGGEAVTTLAGEADQGSAGWADGPGAQARFSCPAGVAVGPGGELYVADYGNNCVRQIVIHSEREEVE